MYLFVDHMRSLYACCLAFFLFCSDLLKVFREKRIFPLGAVEQPHAVQTALLTSCARPTGSAPVLVTPRTTGHWAVPFVQRYGPVVSEGVSERVSACVRE